MSHQSATGAVITISFCTERGNLFACPQEIFKKKKKENKTQVVIAKVNQRAWQPMQTGRFCKPMAHFSSVEVLSQLFLLNVSQKDYSNFTSHKALGILNLLLHGLEIK